VFAPILATDRFLIGRVFVELQICQSAGALDFSLRLVRKEAGSLHLVVIASVA